MRNMCHKKSGMSKKLDNKSEVLGRVECAGNSREECAKRMSEETLVKRAYRVSEEGNRGKGRPQRR